MSFDRPKMQDAGLFLSYEESFPVNCRLFPRWYESSYIQEADSMTARYP